MLMNDIPAEYLLRKLDAVCRAESRRVFATLIRLLGDLDLAEDAFHDAFAAALEQWGRDGVPVSSGMSLTRPDLSGEAVRLARLLNDLLPEPETAGLLA